MKDYKLKLRNLHDSHTLGWSLEVIGDPSRFRVIPKPLIWQESKKHVNSASKRKPRGESGRMFPYLIALTELLKLQKKKRSVSR
jgi:hypothetical protein